MTQKLETIVEAWQNQYSAVQAPDPLLVEANELITNLFATVKNRDVQLGVTSRALQLANSMLKKIDIPVYEEKARKHKLKTHYTEGNYVFNKKDPETQQQILFEIVNNPLIKRVTGLGVGQLAYALCGVKRPVASRGIIGKNKKKEE